MRSYPPESADGPKPQPVKGHHVAETTITDDDITFHEDLTYMGYLLDALEHGCEHHHRAAAGDRTREATCLDFTLNDLRMWWPKDEARAQLNAWAAERKTRWETGR